MTTTQDRPTSVERRDTQKRSEAASTCRCGQPLDTCRREHCPRCGTAVHRTR